MGSGSVGGWQLTVGSPRGHGLNSEVGRNGGEGRAVAFRRSPPGAVSTESQSQVEEPVGGRKNSFIKPLCGRVKATFPCGNSVCGVLKKHKCEEETHRADMRSAANGSCPSSPAPRGTSHTVPPKGGQDGGGEFAGPFPCVMPCDFIGDIRDYFRAIVAIHNLCLVCWL